MNSIEKIFSPNGLLAQKLSAYEHRPEQQQMAEAVERALKEERFLIVEAGTGTGKTLAYLIPAIQSGQRIVISTGTKTLQEQLFFKDIPFLRKEFGWEFKAAFMKGRNNYLCQRRYKLFAAQPLLKIFEEITYYPLIKKWVGRTKTGDRAELTDLPEDLDLWKEICSTSETCLGQKCVSYDHCFITRMRQEAAAADIVIVNHHLFFADLALRQRGYGEVLPRYEAVIFDEAHQLEEVATQYFGIMVSNYRLEELVRDMQREMTMSRRSDGGLIKLAEELLENQEKFFSFFRTSETKYRLQEKHFYREVKERAQKVLTNLSSISAHIEGMKEPPEGLQAISRRAQDLQTELWGICSQNEERLVYWCEIRGRGVFLHASPVEIAAEMKDYLYTKVRTIIFTSATLSARGHFNFFKTRLGLTDVENDKIEELILASSFDMARQALLYLPKTLPDPNEANFVHRAAEEIFEILMQTKGRAFVLFTSIKNMEETYRLLRPRLPFTCFLQGERPKSVLIQEFKEDVHSVLFATASFWEGVDVRGEALSCVIIDRLPFSWPNDPIMEARLEKIASAGKSPFWEYQVPGAIILLKQGLGRLVRTRQDRGILAILDPRLWTKNYGRAFIESLPPCPFTHEQKDISEFFAAGNRESS
ncbi:MAG: ATP-dependent DNA helicase [bacterium]